MRFEPNEHFHMFSSVRVSGHLLGNSCSLRIRKKFPLHKPRGGKN